MNPWIIYGIVCGIVLLVLCFVAWRQEKGLKDAEEEVAALELDIKDLVKTLREKFGVES